MYDRSKFVWLVWAGLVFGGLGVPASVRAQSTARPASADEARTLLKQGSALFLAGKYGEALDVLKKSYALVPSPNSALLIARCLRELGRLVEAQEMFASAEAEARRRAAEGAQKYAQTVEAAAAEGAAVRSALGTLHIRIEGGEPNTKLEMDGVATDIPPDGDLVVWHAPGEVTVSLRYASGLEQKQLVTVRAGVEVTIGFGRPEPQAPELSPVPSGPGASSPSEPSKGSDGPAPARSAGASWAKPAAFVSGAFTLAGAGLFAGFGLASRSEWQDLNKQCGSTQSCGASQRAQAQTGKTEQLIANVSLVAGSAAGVATIAFAIVALSSPIPAKTSSQVRWHLRVGAATVGVDGEFP